MNGNIVQFPSLDGGMTLEEWHEGLARLHARLMAALVKERKQIDAIRLVLSIDDVMDLCQVIEDKLRPDFFDNG